MNLRWKHFLVLVTVSIVPLLAVTWITQNASWKLGKKISGRIQGTLMDSAQEEMVRATRNYASLSLLGGFASEQVLRRLAVEAELALEHLGVHFLQLPDVEGGAANPDVHLFWILETRVELDLLTVVR